MKVSAIICGSRDIHKTNKYVDAIANLCAEMDYEILEVISGGQRGGDFIGEKYALHIDADIVTFHANWGKYGKAAGPKRNEKMINYLMYGCERRGIVIALWDGESKGTKHIIDLAYKYRVVTYTIKVDNDE